MKVEYTEQIQKIDLIQQKLETLQQRLKKGNSPVFIELLGTPKSGKTTLKCSLLESFSKAGIDAVARQETAEYNPIPKKSTEYNIWMVLELFKTLSEDLSKDSGQVIIYDRGILDRIPWMMHDVRNGKMTQKDFLRIHQLYDTDIFRKYRPICKIFLTSPELSIQRKGGEGTFVNRKSIQQYNQLLQEKTAEIQRRSGFSNIVHTDEYQGDIRKFVIDNTLDIISKIERELENRDVNERTI